MHTNRLDNMLIHIRPVVWMAGVVAIALGSTRGAAFASGSTTSQQTINIFDQAVISYSPDTPHGTEAFGAQIVRNGQAVQRTVDLPSVKLGEQGLGKIEAVIHVWPIFTRDQAGRRRPGDPWSRMGALVLARDPDLVIASEDDPETNEIELVRFITGYGGQATFRQDVTALLPLLRGKVTLRAYISTYMNPGWLISVDLEYTPASTPRRPAYAVPIMNNQGVIATANAVKASITIPFGLENVRMRLITTGHATDGAGGDEFTPRANIVRVDGREVARMRPWSSPSGANHAANPMSGRITIQGRELWSSDLDRSGWVPGEVVAVSIIPLPELLPGDHEIEVSVLGIRPEDASENFGYWRISAIIVGDAPWPMPGQ